MVDSRMLTLTRKLYRERPPEVTNEVIAKATGLKTSWLNDFGWERSPDPSVKKVETLFVYLNGKPLDLGDVNV